MNVSLDASALVPLFTNDPFTSRIRAYLVAQMPQVSISDFAAAEFASAVSRRVRTQDLTPADARSAFATFDAWCARSALRTNLTPADVAAATEFIRRLEFNLRTPDALNIAIAQRTAVTLVTFDLRMAENARALGVTVADA